MSQLESSKVTPYAEVGPSGKVIASKVTVYVMAVLPYLEATKLTPYAMVSAPTSIFTRGGSIPGTTPGSFNYFQSNGMKYGLSRSII